MPLTFPIHAALPGLMAITAACAGAAPSSSTAPASPGEAIVVPVTPGPSHGEPSPGVRSPGEPSPGESTTPVAARTPVTGESGGAVETRTLSTGVQATKTAPQPVVGLPTTAAAEHARLPGPAAPSAVGPVRPAVPGARVPADDRGAPDAGPGPDTVYYVYVGAESADLMHRIRFGPDGAAVDRSVPVGEMAVETEGPHGLATSPDGEYVYMTTGHGIPDGKLWKYRAGADTLVAPPILLGRFPATLDLTPDGLYAFVVNFNLHGEHVPSTVSVVYTPDLVEVEQITTCTMPHGLRVAPSGTHLYTNCMMDDQLVEVDTRSFEVSRRFSVAVGSEGPLEGWSPDPPAMASGPMEGSGDRGAPTCSPTWAEPSVDGGVVYVACNKADHILEIDVEGWSVRRTLRAGRAPYNLDVTPDGRLLVATLKGGAAVEFFDLESGESMAVTPSTTTVTHGVVTTPDSRYAFVSVEGVGAEPGKVDVFDLATFERVASVEVGQQAGGITFWKMEAAT